MVTPISLEAHRKASQGNPRSVAMPRPWDGIGIALRTVYARDMGDTDRDFDALLKQLD